MASPTTPRFTHSRDGSDYTYSPSQLHSRRQSRSSMAGGDREGDSLMFGSSGMGLPNSSSLGGMGGNGLGNLADELADALSDDGEGYYEEGEEEEDNDERRGGHGTPGIKVQVGEEDLRNNTGVQEEDDDDDDDHKNRDGGSSAADRRGDGTRDSGVDVAGSGSGAGLGERRNKHLSLSLPPATNGRGHHRRKGSQYDGSEYGSESDLDSPGMPSGLVSKMDAVESLARRGTESNGGHADGVFRRVTDGLRDLSSQVSVESNTSRLITAHTALTTHLTHQTRQIQNLTFPLLNPLAPPPDADTIDSLLPEITTLQEMMPRPSQAAFASIMGLQNLTTDLVHSLSDLSDLLQVGRQLTTTATRRLRSAKEVVTDMRRDEELREEGERWITKGNWGERLERRECASVCGEIVGGFEEVCDGWRTRLAQAEGAQA